MKEGRGKAKITHKKSSSMHAKYKLKSRQRKSTDKRQSRLMMHAIMKFKKGSKKIMLKPISGMTQTWHENRLNKRQR